MARFRLRHRKSEVEHQTDCVIVKIGLPAIAGQKLEIEFRQGLDDARMLPGNGLGLLTPAKDAAHEQAGLRIAFFVKEIKKALVTF